MHKITPEVVARRMEEASMAMGGYERQKKSDMYKKFIQRMGIEPTTSAVLKPRHNQLDHPCMLFCNRRKHLLQWQDRKD
jgi:hypothetical protein